MLGVAGLLIFLYLLLRTFVQADPPSAERRARAEEIVRALGRRHARLLRPAARQELLLLRRRPVADRLPLRARHGDGRRRPDRPARGRPARTLDEFLAFCAERGWRVAFFAVREADAELYRARGMHAIYLGDEAILRCDEFSLDGAGMKAVRAAVKHVEQGPRTSS